MDILKTMIIFAFLLVALNFLTNGYVFQQLTQHNNEGFTKTVACAIGLYFLPPIKEFYGFQIPIPDASDLIIAVIITLVLWAILNSFADLRFYHAILLFFLILIILKLIAFYLVLYAGKECFYIAKTATTLFEPMFWVSLIIGIPALLWMLIKLKIGA